MPTEALLSQIAAEERWKYREPEDWRIDFGNESVTHNLNASWDREFEDCFPRSVALTPSSESVHVPEECRATSSPNSERKARLKALLAKSDAAIAKGAPTYDADEINAEIAETRGSDR